MSTYTYYRHTRTEQAEVPYTFRCEHCSKESGSMWAVVVGTAEEKSNFKTINEEHEKKLRERAHRDLVMKVKEIHKNVVDKKIYSVEFKDACPHCHQPQSWAVSGLRSKLFENPVVALCVGAFFSVIAVLGHYFTDMEYLTLSVAGGIMALGVLAALVLLVWNLIQLGIKTKKTSSGTQKNLPVINWAAVQNLLDEP